MHHRLAELFFLVGALDEIGLVDDIDQMTRFGNAPKHLVDAGAQFPFAVLEFAEEQAVGLADIPMGAARIGAVPAQKRFQHEAFAGLVLKVRFRFGDQRQAVLALAIEDARLGKIAPFQSETPGDFLEYRFGRGGRRRQN